MKAKLARQAIRETGTTVMSACQRRSAFPVGAHATLKFVGMISSPVPPAAPPGRDRLPRLSPAGQAIFGMNLKFSEAGFQAPNASVLSLSRNSPMPR
jgi:hypothetical protein